MDSYENEASKFAAQRTKLKNICEAHDLTYTFIKNSYPIKLIIRPIKGVGEQMSMLETASEDSYISPDAYLLFTMKDGVLVYRMSLKTRPLAAPKNYIPWIRAKNVVG